MSRWAREVRCGVVLALACGLAGGAGGDVVAGDVVTAANADRIGELIPDEVRSFVVDGFDDLRMEIVPTESYPPHPKHVEATVKYACQASLDEHGQIVNYTAGEPFPYSEWAKQATGHACDLDPRDPQLALKLAWNVNYRWLGGSVHMPHWGQSFWRERGDNTWKIAQGEYRRTYYSPRPDRLPESASLEPGTDIEWAEYSETVHPFDLRGTRFLIFRYRNSREKPDDAWMYVPSLRRVRRIPTSEKSDTVQGSDFTFEDFFLFSGYVWDQEWSFGGERTLLAALDTSRRCFPMNVPGSKLDGVGEIGNREQFDSCRFGPYQALPFVDETWQKRTVFQLVQTPKQPGHPYSRRLLWYDKETLSPLMSLAYDREGRPFRLQWYVGNWSETSGIPGNEGKYAILLVASMVVNLQDGVSNLHLGFTTNASELTPAARARYFDYTRLKSGR